MCLQCSTAAETLAKNVLPGFSLMRATQSTEGWQAGQYGLVEMNDPLVVFDGPLLRDPSEGLSDEAINALSEDAFAEVERFLEAGGALNQQLKVDPVAGYRLTAACMQHGYDPVEGGFLGFWLMNHLAKALERTGGSEPADPARGSGSTAHAS